MNSTSVLNFDKEYAKKLAQQSTVISHKALHNPELDPEEYINQLVTQHNQNYPQELAEIIKRLEQNIKSHQEQIEQTKQQISNTKTEKQDYLNLVSTLKSKIAEALAQLQTMLPENQQDIILTNFTDKDYLLKRMQSKMGFMDKLFKGKKQEAEFKKIYSETENLLSELGAETPSGIDIKIKQRTALIDSKTRILNDNLTSLESKLKAEQDNLANKNKTHNELSEKMHQDIADFMHAYGDGHISRTELRKQTPITLNMQGLKEPVSFFQIISGVTIQELHTLLQHAGLSVGNGPSDYMIRQSRDITSQDCLELITPFYSPDSARKNIETLIKYLAAHSVEFKGAIKPATYSQINPTLKNTNDLVDPSTVKHLITKKLRGPTTTNRDAFVKQYFPKDNKIEYLFRGHTFATSDPSSSYATPTWRPGRTGIVYATSDPGYATRYASNSSAGNAQVNGLTMDLTNRPEIDGYLVGFVSVYKNSPRNLLVDDMALEEKTIGKDFKNAANDAQKTWVKETIVSPHNNPLVERYMVVGDKMVRIDENDTEWRQILDAMAPDLARTHIAGTEVYKSGPHQKIHGQKFLQRLNTLAIEYEQNGTVKTHDIPQEILEKMGYKDKQKEFKRAAINIRSNMQAQMINTPEIIME